MKFYGSGFFDGTFLQTREGKLKVCGHNENFMYDGCILGLGENSDSSIETLTDGPVVENVKEIISGVNGTYFLTNDGEYYYCGLNQEGQFGEQAAGPKTPKKGIINNIKQIATGDSVCFLLLNDGTIKCSGTNRNGQLGIGSTATNTKYWNISKLSNVSKIISGNQITLFLMEDGTVKGCGYNGAGVLGQGQGVSGNIIDIVDIPIKNVKDIIVCSQTAIFFINDGTVKITGNGNPIGISKKFYVPTEIEFPVNLNEVQDMCTAHGHILYLMKDGTVKGSGSNYEGQLGLGDTKQYATPITDLGLTDVAGIYASLFHSIFIMKDGTVKGCGYNYYGELGMGKRAANNYYTIITLPMSDIIPWEKVQYEAPNPTPDYKVKKDTGYIEGYVLQSIIKDMESEQLKACGENVRGQLVQWDGFNKKILSLMKMPNNIKHISCGKTALVLFDDGTVKGCGWNSYGQLGFKSDVENIIDMVDINIHDVQQVCLNDISSLFLMKDGTVKGCGFNGYGELGIGNTNTVYEITDVPISNVKHIFGGSSTTFFLMNDGKLKGCGRNVYGKLGIGDTSIKSTADIIDIPVDNVKYVVVTRYVTYFLLNNGKVKGCGYNWYKQLGCELADVETFTPIDIPVENVKFIQAGDKHVLFLLSDGTVKGCGYYESLGLAEQQVPPVELLQGVKDIVTGAGSSLFLMEDDSIQGCGLDSDRTGVFGDPNLTKISTIQPLEHFGKVIQWHDITDVIIDEKPPVIAGPLHSVFYVL